MNLLGDGARHVELIKHVILSILIEKFNLTGLTVTEVLIYSLFAHDLVVHQTDIHVDVLALKVRAKFTF